MVNAAVAVALARKVLGGNQKNFLRFGPFSGNFSDLPAAFRDAPPRPVSPADSPRAWTRAI